MKPAKFYIVREANQAVDPYAVGYMETDDGTPTYNVFTKKHLARRYIVNTLKKNPMAFEIVELTETAVEMGAYRK